MACNIHLIPTSGPGDGRWFLTEAPGGFSPPGTLYVSCDNDVPWVTNSSLPSLTVPLDAACGDLSDIYVQNPIVVGTYVFTYVSPSTEDATSCEGMGESPCGGCSTYTIEVVESPASLPPLEICQDGPAQNLFTIAGLSCVDYTVDYAPPGTPNDSDFDLIDICPGTYGNFVPANITPDVYTFVFTRRNAIPDCTNCEVEMEITIDAQPFTGYDQEDTLCLA